MDSFINRLTRIVTTAPAKPDHHRTKAFDLERILASTSGSADYVNALYAVDLLWQASKTVRQPIERFCILAGLTLVDILHGMGATDARPLMCGNEVSRPEGLSVTCGRPGASEIEDHVNAHLVVMLGDVIVDPLLVQAQRWWNDCPRSAILPVLTEADGRSARWESETKLFKTRRIAHATTAAGCSISYFELPKKVARKAADWQSTPDTRCERREPMVREALRLLKTGADCVGEAV
jgi:hypothetical protein